MSAAKTESSSRGAGFAAGIVRAVGVVTSAVVLMVPLALAALMADWVPLSDYNVTGGDRFIGLMLAGWALAIAGFVWLVALIVAWRKRPLRTRWLVVPPGLLAVGAVMVLVIGMAVPTGFESSRSELDDVAAQVRSHPPGWSDASYRADNSRQVGHLDVGSVSHREDGVVVVSDADSGFFFHMSGWAHAPEGPPTFDPGVRGLEVDHLGGDWYSYSYVL